MSAALKSFRAHLAEFTGRCQQRGWGAALFHVGVQKHLVADVEDEVAALGDAGYAAEQADREALKILERVTADGRIDQSEMASVALAVRLVRRSAEKDKLISDIAGA